MPTEHKISTLKINKLTDAQYNSITKSASELYLTPDEDSDSFVLKPATIIDADNTDLDIEANTIYKFRNVLTTLTLSSIEISDYESIIYFTTSSSISFTDNSNLIWKNGTIPSLEANTKYRISICNGYAVIDNFGTIA